MMYTFFKTRFRCCQSYVIFWLIVVELDDNSQPFLGPNYKNFDKFHVTMAIRKQMQLCFDLGFCIKICPYDNKMNIS